MSRLIVILATVCLLGSSLIAAAAPPSAPKAPSPAVPAPNVPSPTAIAPATTAPTTQQWVSDFPAFLRDNGSREWIVGRSQTPAVSEQEAFDQARSNAASQLRKLLRATLTPSLFKSEGEAWIKDRVAREFTLGNIIVERAATKTHRPYADIWSAAVLVDTSPDRLGPIARDYDAWRHNRAATARSTGFSLVGLSLAILAIYCVMNALTRGYFRGRLRAGASLTLALGTFFLIWLARA